MNPSTPQIDPSSISLDPAAARAALHDVELIASRTRKAIAQGPASSMLILWGCIWATAFSVTEFAPSISGAAWLILDSAGIIGSMAIAIFAKSPVVGRPDGRIGLFWLVLFSYAGLWFWMLKPSNGNDIGAFWSTVPMFAYVVGGLWLSRFFVYLGLVVTVFTVIGLTLFAPHFNLWMAILGGGSLIVSGIYIRRNWR